MGLFLLHTLGIYMGPWSPTHPPTTPTPTPPHTTHFQWMAMKREMKSGKDVLTNRST